MTTKFSKRSKTIRCIALQAFVALFFLSCTPKYHIENHHASLAQPTTYSTYQFILIDSKDQKQKQEILQALTEGFFKRLETMGFVADSINSQLLFLFRLEEHLIRVGSTSNSKDVKQNDEATNPVYEDPSNYDEEFFIRVQAIDAMRNDLIWSVKVYPRKKHELQPRHVPRIADDLIQSFRRQVFLSPKTNNP